MEELSQESAEYYKSKIDSYKKQNEDLTLKISELEKVYYGFFLKLDYYEQNSHVKPPEEIDVSIYKQELQFSVLHNKWRKEKEALIIGYEEKIEELLRKLKNTSNNEEKGIKKEVKDLPLDTSSPNDLELLKSKLSDAINNEKEMKRKLVEAAKKMKTMKEEITSLKSQPQLPSNPNPNPNLQTNPNKTKFNLSELSSLKDQALSLKNEVKSFQSNFLSSLHSSALNLITREREASNSQLSELKAKLSSEMRERKKLFNLLQELKGNIRVLCRIRPLSANEGESCLTGKEDGLLTAFNKETNEYKSFEYDKVFGADSKQEEVFVEVEPLITSILDGYNVCIFAYGQTGSGKTYTMQGPKENPGVFNRTILQLFRVMAEREGTVEYSFEISLLEIYNEGIRDLLSPEQNRKLEVKQGGGGNYVPNLTQIAVKGPEEVEGFLEFGTKNRAVGKTNMNEHSSRSHLVFTITVLSKNKLDNTSYSGKLHLIDLAGSERLSKTKVQGEAQKESISINKSLSALGDVISAKTNKNPHIPFRNSILTYFLQDSLSGDAKLLMVLQLSPAEGSFEETVSSCKFGARAKMVELGGVKKNMAGGKK